MRDLKLNASQRQVLDIIWRHGPIPRVEIEPRTNLSAMSITRITKELADHGLLIQDVHRTGARGQPTRPLMIRPDAAFAAGVYFSTQSVQVGLVNLAGTPVDSRRLVVDARTPQIVAKAANLAIREMTASSGIPDSQLIGVGFALPGDFISDRKRLNAHAFFPDFGGDDLQAALSEAMDYPVFIENDAASAALGERLVGVGQRIRNFFFAHIGHGIGGGLIINGELYRGAQGNAGIIGVQYPNDAPRPTGQDLFRTLGEAGLDAQDFDALQSLRPQDCPPLKSWINRASDQLRQGLWITARVLDPDAIIIGGRLPAHLLQEIVARVDDETFCNEGVHLPRPKVFCSSLGPSAGMIGAAAVPLYDCFLLPRR